MMCVLLFTTCVFVGLRWEGAPCRQGALIPTYIHEVWSLYVAKAGPFHLPGTGNMVLCRYPELSFLFIRILGIKPYSSKEMMGTVPLISLVMLGNVERGSVTWGWL